MLARRILLLGLLLAGASVFIRTGSAQDASTADGVYTEAQGRRGDTLYHQQCSSCHGKALEGSGQTPPLSGDDFIQNWRGQTLADLFDKIQGTMPADHPGQLTREQTADVLSYVLAANKFPAGKSELPPDEDALKKIHIVAPPQS